MSYRKVLLGVLFLAAASSAGMAAGGAERTKASASEPSAGKWRDPFWPIDYAPKVEVPEPEISPVVIKPVRPRPTPRVKIEWPELRVSAQSTRTDGTAIALVDDVGFVEAGDEISLVRGGVQYSWRVDSISREGARFVQLVAKPVQRPQR